MRSTHEAQRPRHGRHCKAHLLEGHLLWCFDQLSMITYLLRRSLVLSFAPRRPKGIRHVIQYINHQRTSFLPEIDKVMHNTDNTAGSIYASHRHME